MRKKSRKSWAIAQNMDEEGDPTQQHGGGESSGVEKPSLGTGKKKRPANSFIQFYNDFKKQCRDENRKFGRNKMIEAATSKWKSMTNAEKEPYQNLAKWNDNEGSDKPNKERKVTMKARSGVPTFFQVMNCLTDAKKDAVRSIGFGRLLDIKCSKLDLGLCQYLLDRLDVKDSARPFISLEHGQGIFFTQNDVRAVFGIPQGERSIKLQMADTNVLHHVYALDRRMFCEEPQKIACYN